MGSIWMTLAMAIVFVLIAIGQLLLGKGLWAAVFGAIAILGFAVTALRFKRERGVMQK